MDAQTLLFLIYSAWLAGLTFIAVWIFIYFKRLTKDIDKGNLITLLGKIVKQDEIKTESIRELENKIKKLEEAGEFHVQKMGVVRFNPFYELGGDHSFAVTLLDGRNSGFIITGLHARERTRIYVKEIKGGKVKHKLSSEEEKSLRIALKSN